MDSNLEKCIKASLSDLYQVRRRLERDVINGREKSLAITKIDEAAMWVKSIPVPVDDRRHGEDNGN